MAAACLAVAGHDLGGLRLHARAGPVRDLWIDELRQLIGHATPWKKIPVHCGESRLLGGLDLAATLQAGRPISEMGLLASCHEGMVSLPMAERAPPFLQSTLCRVLDESLVRVERDGLTEQRPCSIAVLALDEGVEDESPGEPLLDRLALSIDLDELSLAATDSFAFVPADINKARNGYSSVSIDDSRIQSICQASDALGIWSPRISVLACRCARVLAALAGDKEVGAQQLDQVLRLVLLPRATRLPAQDQEDDTSSDQLPPEEAENSEPPAEPTTDRKEQTLSEDRIVEAAKAMLPDDLLSRLAAAQFSARKNSNSGKSGVIHKSKLRGRPSGTTPGDPRDGARLDLLATLRAAVPWQKLRGKPKGKALLQVSTQDFRVKRFQERSPSVTVFAVDASGSSALYRLAEAKGAIELLLADCYIRRDEVALIAFKGQGAELLLPPTRSLVRAKRCLAAMPGGGGTPLASAIELGAMTLQQLERKGCTPVFVLLTDGRANVSRDGSTGRAAAMDDAKQAATSLRAQSGARGLVIDTSPRPHRTAAELAEWLAVDYLPLPNADSKNLQAAVSATVNA